MLMHPSWRKFGSVLRGHVMFSSYVSMKYKASPYFHRFFTINPKTKKVHRLKCLQCVAAAVFPEILLPKTLFLPLLLGLLSCVSVCTHQDRSLRLSTVQPCLCSQSAPSCCFHSSSESQHSQPRSLPRFTLLVPARSVLLLFSFCGSLSQTVDSSLLLTHSFIQAELTKIRQTKGRWRV